MKLNSRMKYFVSMGFFKYNYMISPYIGMHFFKKTEFIIMGIFCVFIPLSFITLAPRYIPAHEVELFFVLETALGPFWVWLVIHEQPSIKTIIGGVCIVLLIFTHTFLEFKEKKSN